MVSAGRSASVASSGSGRTLRCMQSSMAAAMASSMRRASISPEIRATSASVRLLSKSISGSPLLTACPSVTWIVFTTASSAAWMVLLPLPGTTLPRPTATTSMRPMVDQPSASTSMIRRPHRSRLGKGWTGVSRNDNAAGRNSSSSAVRRSASRPRRAAHASAKASRYRDRRERKA